MNKTPKIHEVSGRRRAGGPLEPSLCLIAIIPPHEVVDRVRAVQQEIADNFGPRRILKVPVHITLEPSFRIDIDDLPRLAETLAVFAKKEPAVPIELKNFGCFRQDTVFIQVTYSQPLIETQKRLSEILRDKSGFIAHPARYLGYYPHVTVANRDVNPEEFKQVWAEFTSRKFHSRFDLTEISLLCHDGNLWQIHARFPLLPGNI